ncbi:MAG: NTP transferase domain-containing protein [Akkermansiaceae bacterium]|nr:NTP transferase domain-containing protein [Akkermansiaceae bacterium]
MKPSLVVLAAGMGSRYGGLKQMDPMGPNGETVLDYSVFDAIRAGFGKVVFVIREDFAEAFKQSVGTRFAERIELDYAFQQLDDIPEGFSVPEGRKKPWGTSHAVRAARHAVGEHFAVINADDFYGRDAYARAADYFAQLPEGTRDETAMVGYPLENTLSEHGHVNRGICELDSEGTLARVEEILEIRRGEDGVIRGCDTSRQPIEIEPGAMASMNFWLFGPDFFRALETAFVEFMKTAPDPLKSECYLPSVIDDMIQTGQTRCPVLRSSSQWFGVTYPEDKSRVVDSIARLIKAGEYPNQLT